MDEPRMALVAAAGALHGNPDPEAHKELRDRVMTLALTPAQTIKMADALATAEAQAENEVGQAESRLARGKFRMWMRVQATAEQGQVFKAPPTAAAVVKGDAA